MVIGMNAIFLREEKVMLAFFFLSRKQVIDKK